MGASALTNNSPAVSPARKPKPLRLRIDVPLILVIVSLLVLGLLMVYSASWEFALRMGQETNYVLVRQAGWILLGTIVAAALTLIDYHRLGKILIPMMLTTFMLLFMVLLIGDARFGATRTLFNGSIQPSELTKLTTIIYLSFWLYSKRDRLNNITFGLIPMTFILGISAGMILTQPDLSAAITVVVLGGLLFFLAGGEMRQIVLVVAVAAVLGWVVVTLSSTGRTRLAEYIAGFQDPSNASYHVRRAMEAVVKGGLFGVGIGKGSTKFTGLPVPWTDSIFAVITEETGLVGAATTVMLYVVFLWRGLVIAQRAQDLLGKLLASGITIWISMEALVNMGVMVNLIPFAGNALPLVSAGGSSLTMTLAGLGILMNVARTGKKENASTTTEGRSFGAIVDLRRRDRRRRVSRSRNPEGARQ
jgi:cell division protein FtsW